MLDVPVVRTALVFPDEEGSFADCLLSIVTAQNLAPVYRGNLAERSGYGSSCTMATEQRKSRSRSSY
jgi:hypothetical protein